MTNDYLAILATSVLIECAFSSGVDLVTPIQRKLDAETIRACMCLKE